MTAAQKIIPFPKKEVVRRNEHELAFLPAALEIVETPPSPIGRAIGVSVMALFCLALAWASFGTVDIVATAAGKIIPSGRTKIVQPFEIGVVSAIHVRDGQSVKAGEVLIELDPTMTEAERDHLKSDFVSAELEVARLRAALSTRADPFEDFHPPEGASPALIEMNKQFLLSQVAEQQSKIAAIDRQVKQKEAERDTITAAIAKIEATIPVLTQKVDIRKYLYDKDLGSKITYLTDYQDLVGMQQEALVQKSKYQEADAAVAALTETRAQTAAEYRRTRFEELAKAEQKAAGLAQDVIKAEQRTKLQVLTAPVDGVVQQLAVHTIGGVVTPGAGAARRGAARQPSRNRSHGVEPRHWLRPCRPEGRGQGRYLQLHPLWAAARRGASTSRRTPSPATSRRTNPTTTRRARKPPAASPRARK